MKGGESAPVTGDELRALRKKHGMTQAQFALLASSSVFLGKQKQLIGRRMQAWEAGENRMPLASWEVLQLRLKLMEYGATFEEVLRDPLVEITVNVMTRYRKTLAELAKT